MADEELKADDPELDLEAEQPSDQPEDPEASEPESEQPEETAEASPPVEAQEPVEEPQRPSRRDTRIASLTDRLKEADAERETFRRRLAEVEQRYQQPKAQESPEQRAQRRALMTPQEVMTEELNEAKNSFTQQLQQVQWQNAETADRTTFQAKCASNPLYAKYAPKVEGKLAELRTRGINSEREVLLKYLIGEAALERMSSKEGKQEVRQAQQRVKRATVRPSNSGSDEAATRRREESLERRLENLNI